MSTDTDTVQRLRELRRVPPQEGLYRDEPHFYLPDALRDEILAALDRLAAAEAQRDTLAERIEEVRVEFKANITTSQEQMVAMPEYVEFWRGRRGAFQDALGSLLKVRADLAAVAPTEAAE